MEHLLEWEEFNLNEGYKVNDKVIDYNEDIFTIIAIGKWDTLKKYDTSGKMGDYIVENPKSTNQKMLALEDDKGGTFLAFANDKYLEKYDESMNEEDDLDESNSVLEGFGDLNPEMKKEIKEISTKAKSFVSSKGGVKGKIVISPSAPIMISIKAEDESSINPDFRLNLIKELFNKDKKDGIKSADPSYSSGGAGINSGRIQLSPSQWKKVLGL